VLFFFSCDKSASDQEKIKLYLQSCGFATQHKRMFIIPSSGCTSCISTAEEYMAKSADKSDIGFLLTRIDSKKLAKSKARNRENIYLDTLNVFNFEKLGLNPIYPVEVNLVDDQMEYTSLTPQKRITE
jgi:hypothetical protein